MTKFCKFYVKCWANNNFLKDVESRVVQDFNFFFFKAVTRQSLWKIFFHVASFSLHLEIKNIAELNAEVKLDLDCLHISMIMISKPSSLGTNLTWKYQRENPKLQGFQYNPWLYSGDKLEEFITFRSGIERTSQHIHDITFYYSTGHYIIATDKVLFSSEKCLYLPYFSTKTYVVGTH